MGPPPHRLLVRVVVFAAAVAVLTPSAAGSFTSRPETRAAQPQDAGHTMTLAVERRVAEDVPPELHRKGLSQPEKRALFIRTLLPLVLLENERLERQRARMLGLVDTLEHGRQVGVRDSTWLSALAAEYKLKGDPLQEPKVRRELRDRVDVIPPALALAQAAVETGWGASSAARKDRDLFGMTAAVSKRSRGQRRARGTHKKRHARFVSLQDSVQSYIHNLNTHPAYKRLRTLRAKARAADQPVAATHLAKGLAAYAELGQRYVRSIQATIRNDHLAHYDAAALRPEAAASFAALEARSPADEDASPVMH